MQVTWSRSIPVLIGTLLLAGSVGAGCTQVPRQADFVYSDMPRELQKVSLPTYVVEPPDILLIEAITNIRNPDSPLMAGEEIIIRVSSTLEVAPTEDPILAAYKRINGGYVVDAHGTVDLGPIYGTVKVAGMTVEQAKKAIEAKLKTIVNTEPQVSVVLADVKGRQEIAGEHLVRPDGTVSLGVYGGVNVAGLTLDQARACIEEHLSNFIHEPEVKVDVLSYNSKFYYIITDGGGYGERVIRIPCTGNETVLDAFSLVDGLPEMASKKDVWIARPAPPELGTDQILPVDWNAIVRGGSTMTNYQVFPGDRLYVKADNWIVFDNVVNKVTSPFERIFGFTLLGNSTVRQLQRGSSSAALGGGIF